MFLFKKLLKLLRCLRLSTVIAMLAYTLFILLLLKYAMPKSRNFGNSTNGVPPAMRFYQEHSSVDYGEINEKTIRTVILAASAIDENTVLKTAFNSANLNNDDHLTIEELGRYINKKIREHTDKAIKMNPLQFSKVDKSPRDGLVTWDEYHKYFLRERGFDEAYITEHSEAKHVKLDRKAKEDMMRDKARWSEAARTDPFSLTLDEFLAFQHPESSTVNLLGLVDDILRLFDIDGDERLTMDEFCDVTVDEDDEKYRKSIISKTVKERRAEFTRIIDQNKDGKADRGELLSYVDPRHPRYALQEAATLVNLTDSNKDGKLSFDEIKASSNIFMTSKMIDTASSFHEEF